MRYSCVVTATVTVVWKRRHFNVICCSKHKLDVEDEMYLVLLVFCILRDFTLLWLLFNELVNKACHSVFVDRNPILWLSHTYRYDLLEKRACIKPLSEEVKLSRKSNSLSLWNISKFLDSPIQLEPQAYDYRIFGSFIWGLPPIQVLLRGLVQIAYGAKLKTV